jgi:hypothetical protein
MFFPVAAPGFWAFLRMSPRGVLWVVLLVVLFFLLSLKALGAQPLVSVHGVGIPVKDAIRQIARQSGTSIQIVPGVAPRKIDLSLTDVSLESALRMICSVSGLGWERLEEGYRVSALDEKGAPVTSPVTRQQPPPPPEPAPRSRLVYSVPQEEAMLQIEAQQKETEPEEEPRRELKLNAAQLQLVLQGVPNARVNSVLNQWRRDSASRRWYPGGYNPPLIYGPVIYNLPQGHRLRYPPDFRYQHPNGSVWFGYNSNQYGTTPPFSVPVPGQGF